MTELWTLVKATAQNGAITTCQHINRSAYYPENGVKSPTFNGLALCGICFLERVSVIDLMILYRINMKSIKIQLSNNIRAIKHNCSWLAKNKFVAILFKCFHQL